MTYISGLRDAAAARHDLLVDTAVLGACDGGAGVQMGLGPHRQLARAVLDAGSVEAAREIPTDHPYHRYYKRADSLAGWEWGDLLAYRARTVFSIKEDGIKLPVEAFFDDDRLVYFHGFHRLTAALELGIEQVRLRAYVSGDFLPALTDRLLSLYPGDEHRHTLYQPVDHPLFRLLPVQGANAAWEEKVAAVLGVAGDWPGKVVEIGAHFGMLTRALRAAGVDAEAVDIGSVYLELQPLFAGIGLAEIPYRLASAVALAREDQPCRLVMMGLAHHFTGSPALWPDFRDVVLPWMRRRVPEAVVEMSLLAMYQGEPAAVPMTSDEDVAAFWSEHGFAATRMLEGSWSRVTYRLVAG